MAKKVEKTPEELEIQQTADEYERYKALDILAKSKGGKILIEAAKKDVASLVQKIAYNFSTMTDIELKSTCAMLSPKLTLIRTLQNSESNADVMKEDLEELLKKQKPE